MSLKRILAATAVLALTTAPVAGVGLMLATDAVYAQSNKVKGKAKRAKITRNDKGKSRDRRASRNARSGTVLPGAEYSGSPRPSVNSELQGLNAVSSFANSQAPAHADEQGNVGRIAVYQVAYVEASDAFDAFQSAQDALEAHMLLNPGYSSRDILAQIERLDPQSASFDAELAELTAALDAALAYESLLLEYQQAAMQASADYDAKAAAEELALMEASGGRSLSDDAMDFLTSALGF